MKNEPGLPDLVQLKRAVVETQIQQGLLHSVIMDLGSDASLEMRRTAAMRLRRLETNMVFTALPDVIPHDEQLALHQHLVAGLIDVIPPHEANQS